MDWTEKASRDFSLVVWSTERGVGIFKSDGTTTTNFPYTQRRADDLNAAQENGSDLCADNPKLTGFKRWYESFDRFQTNACTGSYAESKMVGIYEYFIF